MNNYTQLKKPKLEALDSQKLYGRLSPFNCQNVNTFMVNICAIAGQIHMKQHFDVLSVITN